MRYREYLRLKWDRENPLFRRRLGPGPVTGLLLFLANAGGAMAVLWWWDWILQQFYYWLWASMAVMVSAIATLWLAGGRMPKPMLEELSLTRLSRREITVALLRANGWVYFPLGLVWIAGIAFGTYRLFPPFGIRNTIGNSLGVAAALLVAWAIALRVWLSHRERGPIWIPRALGAAIVYIYFLTCYLGCMEEAMGLLSFSWLPAAARIVVAPLLGCLLFLLFPFAVWLRTLSLAEHRLFSSLDPEALKRAHWLADESGSFGTWLRQCIAPPYWPRRAFLYALAQTALIVVLVELPAAKFACGVPAPRGLADEPAPTTGYLFQLSLWRHWTLAGVAIILPALQARVLGFLAVERGRIIPALIDQLRPIVILLTAAFLIEWRLWPPDPVLLNFSLYPVNPWFFLAACIVGCIGVASNLLPRRGRGWRIAGWVAFGMFSLAVTTVCSGPWSRGPLPGLGYPFGAFGQYFVGLLGVASLLMIGFGFPGLERFHREQVAGEGAA